MPPTDALAQTAGWLACPQCGASLSLNAGSLTCGQGHCFDVARQGYVNLLGRATPLNADTAPMCDARDQFLARGHYRPILDRVDAALGAARRVLEVGAGTGWYLSNLVDRRPDALGMATDVSVAAARRAARAHPRVAAVVADTWAGLPVRDAAVDAVVCVFAPRNSAEFGRVLVPGGRLVVAVPGPHHLAELRQRLGLLGIGADKVSGVTEALGADFRADGTQRVRTAMDLDDEEARLLVAMGPNAFHGIPDVVPGGRATLDVTVATFTRR